MQIFIKSSSEAKRPFVVESSTSILELKAKIEDEMKIPVSAQRLIYSGRVLKDSDTFGSIGAIEDVTIHLVKSIPVSGGSAASQTTVSAQATPQSTPSTTEPFSNNFCTKTNHYIATQTAGIPPFPGMFGSEFAAGGTDFSSAASSFNPAIMQAMLANPELLRQATQLLASNPDLLNMAMRGQQGGLCHIVRPYLGNNAFLQNPAAMQAAMQAFSDPTVMQQMMSIFANPTGKCIYVEHPYRIGIPPVTPNVGAPAFAPLSSQTPSSPALIPPEERFKVQLTQLADMGFYDAAMNIRALLATGGHVEAAIEYILSQFK